MAFEQIEPFGDVQQDRRVKVLASWLCTMLGSRAYDTDDIKGISPELPPIEDDDSEPADEPLDDLGDFSGTPSSSDVLRDLSEQNLFR